MVVSLTVVGTPLASVTLSSFKKRAKVFRAAISILVSSPVLRTLTSSGRCWTECWAHSRAGSTGLAGSRCSEQPRGSYGVSLSIHLTRMHRGDSMADSCFE
jgi:hypothetical protein